MNITNELRVAAFACHMHCKATVVDIEDGIVRFVAGVFCLDEETACVTLHPEDSYPDDYDVSKCRLILRSPASISVEHCVEVAKMANIPSWRRDEEWGCDSENYITIGNEIVSELCDGDCRVAVNPDAWVAIIDKLREWGYLTKFRGIDLIQAGIAILEEGREGI